MTKELRVCCQLCDTPIPHRLTEQNLFIICEECLRKAVKALRPKPQPFTRQKPLTPQEQQQFKELYEKGYTARMIFMFMGQPLKGKAANTKMERYRRKLKLKPRPQASKINLCDTLIFCSTTLNSEKR